VISVGNLSAGGSGKTPAVAYLARLLLARGERPAILTRGYARPVRTAGVTVVSDPASVLASFDTAGDEPLMLARNLPGIPVLVGADRYRSGLLAESRFGSTVHLLDDGFQHLKLGRDVDLLLVSENDLTDRVLPAGRLREPLASASAADALVVATDRDDAIERVRRALGIADAFRLRRSIGPAPGGEKVFAVAGIARPQRFFDALAGAGWNVAGTMRFADHHRFDAGDIDRIVRAARDAGATTVLTTEKDAVRLEGRTLGPLPLTVVPLKVTIEPADRFETWPCERSWRSSARCRSRSSTAAARGSAACFTPSIARIGAWPSGT
jgi:tetraacyldisaccharide 4'-kinase